MLPLVPKARARSNGAHASNGQSPLCAAAIANIHTPPPLSEDGLRRVWTALSYIGSENRDDWLRVGGALHDITSWPEETRRAFFELWSVLLDGSDPKKFDPAEQQTTWESYSRSYDGPPTTLGTIIHWAKENGWDGRTLKPLPGELLRFFAAIDDAPAQDKPGDASLSDAEVDAEIARLADLPVAQYERERKPTADGLGLRLSVLDRLVDQLRPDDTDHADGQGRTLKLVEPEPWPTAVDGAQLVCELAKAVLRYVVLPQEAAATIALWVLHAYVYELFTVTPRLCITAPEKRCGKTTLLDVIERLVPRALPAVNITAAAVFRTIEFARPTLVIDEADNLFGRSSGNSSDQSRELLAILNSGHRKGGQTIRNVPLGDGYEARAFSTFCPLVLALIGKLPSTLEDRSIAVELQRRLAGEPVERLRIDRTDDLHRLARQARRWTDDNRSRLAECDPELPPELFNRVADNWRPLIAIADVVGGYWPRAARLVAVQSVTRSEDDALRIMLLSDIRTIFVELNVDRLLSDQIIEGLKAKETRPWADFRRGQPINPKQLASLLRPFKIEPDPNPFEVEEARSMVEGRRPQGPGKSQLRRGRGYYRATFEDAFARYLPPLKTD